MQCIKKKVRPSTAAKCFNWLYKFAETPENLDILCEKGIADRVVDVLSSLPWSNDELTVGMVETGLMVVHKVARANKATTVHMDGVIKVMDTYKARKGVVDVSNSFFYHMIT